MSSRRQRGSQKVLRLKSKAKFYFRTVRSRVISILKRVEVGDYPSKIARIYGWSKQHVFYYLGKLQKAGLVRRKVRSNCVFYELTAKTYLAILLNSINLNELIMRADEATASAILSDIMRAST